MPTPAAAEVAPPADEIVLFASSAARPAIALSDVKTHVPLSRDAKTLQGQILLSVDGNTAVDELAASLLRLSSVDYVHILLASSAIEDGGLAAIRAAAAAVDAVKFDRALELWRACARLEGSEAAAALPTRELVFRSLGKRGGKGHEFSSDDAKRAAKEGLTAATGLLGSSSKAASHLDVLAQVHCNRFWLGLRLNRVPLALQPTAPQIETRAKQPPPAVASALDSGQSAAQPEATPQLLSSWLASRLASLGLDRPRDARDAVAPLWEMPVAEQRERKQQEMSALVERTLRSTAAAAPAEAAAAATVEATTAAAVQCEAIRGSEASTTRNTCEFHVGRGRDGLPCCGFRLGTGGGRDGKAVGGADGVPFVPAWMLRVAATMTEAMRAYAAAAAVGAEAGDAPLPYQQLRLRGSARTREAVAVLTPAADDGGSKAAAARAVGSAAEAAESALAKSLVRAAAEDGQCITAVLVRDERGGSGGGWRSLLDPASDGDGASRELGAITEELESGLRLQIAPLAFFQASTDAAEALFRAVVDLATRGGEDFPPLLLDLCCGGGVLGLEVARAAAKRAAAAASGEPHVTTRVLGIELNASAVRDAQRNALANGLRPPAYDARCAKVEDAIDELLDGAAADGDSPTASGAVAILDPPRTGVHPSVCKALRRASAVKRVVFVSCNPHGHTLRHDYVVKGGSLQANAKILCGARGRGAPFALVRALPLDLFTHTPHVELCLLFER